MATLDGYEAVKCADCARSDSAVTDLLPSQRLAIPVEALAGGPAEVPRGRAMTRRSALMQGVAGVASVYAVTKLPWDQIWEAAAAEAAGNPARKIVLIYLQGGADGLNMFVPADDTGWGVYDSLRGNIARTRAASTSLTDVGSTVMGNTGNLLGFANPLLSGGTNNQLYPGISGTALGLDTVYGDGSGGAGSNLAIFPAADYNPPNLSHFDSRDFWFAGALSKLTTGWLGRWLDAEGSRTNPLQAISLDSSLSKQIRTSLAPVCALDGIDGIQFRVNNVSSSMNLQINGLAGVAASSRNVALRRSRQTYRLTTQVSSSIKNLHPVASTAPYPDSYLSDRLQLAAQLLAGGLGTRVITIDWGSFDTHGDEVAGMDPQLAVLGSALAAFQQDLTDRGIADDTITVVFSEFGRRVGSNDSAGTDHGAGGAMMVMGTKVKGGLASEPSNLAALDDNGDLVVTTDFRKVYKAIFSEWLGTDPRKYLPDAPAGTISRYDSTTNLLKP
jgi:uncharacterized protein (DUF1501 family)